MLNENEELQSKIDNYKEMIESLTTTSSLVQENMQKEKDQLHQKLDDQMAETKRFIQNTSELNDKFVKLEIEYNNLTQMSQSDEKSLKTLKETYEQCRLTLEEKSNELKSLRLEVESLNRKLSECNGVHKLEMAEVRAQDAAVRIELELKVEELGEKLGLSEKHAVNLEKDLQATLKELSEMKSELIGYQEDYENQKSEWQAEETEKFIEINSKAAKFELMYKDEVERVSTMQEQFKEKYREMTKSIELLNDVSLF